MRLPAAARDWDAALSARLAMAAVVLAGLLALWALSRALRVEGAPAARVATAAIQPPVPAPRVAAVSVREVVAHDPFSPYRSAPAARYRLPGEEAPPSADSASGARRARPQLIGTVVAVGGGHSFAICQLARNQPVMLHVGERLGDFTVAEIARGRVVFTTPAGARVVVENP